MSERIQNLLLVLGVIAMFFIAMTDPVFADWIIFWE